MAKKPEEIIGHEFEECMNELGTVIVAFKNKLKEEFPNATGVLIKVSCFYSLDTGLPDIPHQAGIKTIKKDFNK